MKLNYILSLAACLLLNSNVIALDDAKPSSIFTKFSESIYVGVGATGVSGTSENLTISNITAPILVVGGQIHDHLGVEAMITLSQQNNNESFTLDKNYSINLIADMVVSKHIALLGKLGAGHMELNKGTGSIDSGASFSYGVGMRYQHDQKRFIDITFDKILSRTIDGREEDFNQVGIAFKQRF